MAEYIRTPMQVVNEEANVIFSQLIPTIARGFGKADLMAKNAIELIVANSIYRKRVAWKFRKRNPKTRYKQLEKARKMRNA